MAASLAQARAAMCPQADGEVVAPYSGSSVLTRGRAAGRLAELDFRSGDGQALGVLLQERRQRRARHVLDRQGRVIAGERQIAGRAQGAQAAEEFGEEGLDAALGLARPRALGERL